jgi:gas vesicle protein
LVVNAHGCALRFPKRLDAGSALRLHNRGGRQATAYVVVCQPMGPDEKSWLLGASLDRPENFWGLESYPEDWQVVEMPTSEIQSIQKFSNAAMVVRKPQAASKASQAFLDKIEEQLSEDRLRGILAKLVRPLQAEVDTLQERLSRSARQNRFEVSLGNIPPELEDKLWERLRQDLGTRVLQQTREQAGEMLGSAQAAIEQKIGEALAEFRNRLSGELHAVQRRAQALSKELTVAAEQQLHAGVEKLQHEALDAGAELNAQSEKLLEALQRRLVETHNAHCQMIDQFQSEAAAKSAHLQSEVTSLDRRIATLNESVRHLESDLDAHLERLGSEIVADVKAQLESATASVLKDLQKHGANEVQARVDEACGHLRTIQNRIETSFSGSLQTQGEEAAHSVAQQFEFLAQQSVDRWRQALANDLNSAAKTLGQELKQAFKSETHRD